MPPPPADTTQLLYLAPRLQLGRVEPLRGVEKGTPCSGWEQPQPGAQGCAAELDLPTASLGLVAALPASQPAFLSGFGGTVKGLRHGPGFNLPKTVIFCLFSENIRIASGISPP